VNGERIDSSRRIRISDPVTGEELAGVTDTQKDGLDRAVRAANAAFPLWSSKTWTERRDLLANAMAELKAHADELCTILTAENGRLYSMAQFEIKWILKGKFHRRVPVCFSPSPSWTIRLRKRLT
jgi:succinate-semialdehyde dehydrogenase/glutarate-semialdehyde dehydrogenase